MNELPFQETQVIELSLASRKDAQKNIQAVSPPTIQKPSYYPFEHESRERDSYPCVDEFPLNQGQLSLKAGQMSDFSYILQEGLQNARRQSQQEIKIKQLLSQFQQNMMMLKNQLQQTEFLIRLFILKEEEEQINSKISFLLNSCQRIKEKYENQKRTNRTAKKRRFLSPTYCQQEKYRRKDLVNFIRKKEDKKVGKYVLSEYKRKAKEKKCKDQLKNARSLHKISTSSSQKYDSVKTRDTVKRQKALLQNRIQVIKESIQMTIEVSQKKIQKLCCENSIIKEEIQMIHKQLGEYEIKLSRKQNISKNLNQIVYGRQKSLGLRKVSFMNRKKSKSNVQISQSLNRKKTRINSLQKKDAEHVQKTPLIQYNVREQYFDNRDDRVRTYNKAFPSANNLYYP